MQRRNGMTYLKARCPGCNEDWEELEAMEHNVWERELFIFRIIGCDLCRDHFGLGHDALDYAQEFVR